MTTMAARFETDFYDADKKMGRMHCPNNVDSNSSITNSSLCVGCGSAIYDPFILHVQPNLEWHCRCLNCSKCHRSLGNDATCFVKDGKAYCREDYFNTFLYRCAGCHRIIDKSDLVFRIRSRTFHLDCFRCNICERLLQPGEEIAFRFEQVYCLTHAHLASKFGNAFLSQLAGPQSPNKTVLCSSSSSGPNSDLHSHPYYSHHLNLDTSERFGSQIKSNTNLTVDLKLPKQEPTNRGLLPSLLSRIESSKCAMDMNDELDSYEDACVLDDYKTKSGLNHSYPVGSNSANSLNEFSEVFCSSSPGGRVASPSSSFGVRVRDTDSPLSASSEDGNSSLLGMHAPDSAITDSGNGMNGPNSMTMGTQPLSLPYNNSSQVLTGMGTGGGGDASRTGSSSSGTSVTGIGDEVIHSVVISRGNSRPSSGKSGLSKRSKDQKTTRVRTVLNEKQLHTLRTCYAANPRPDALMKEQLVEMTSLSPRVIRVWFQNKRCKDKKRQLLLKQMEQHQQNGGRPGTLHGVSMIAHSPVRNDANLMCANSGIEVQQIPGPYWTSQNSNDLLTRPNAQCSIYRPNSPNSFQINKPTKIPRTSVSPNGTVSSLAGAPVSVSTGLNSVTAAQSQGSISASDGMSNYPSSILSSSNPNIIGPSNQLATLSGPAGTTNSPNNGISITTNGSNLSLLHPAPADAPMSRPNMSMPSHGTLPISQSGFGDEPQISAFQQLMFTFDNTDPPVTVPDLNFVPPPNYSLSDYPKSSPQTIEQMLFNPTTCSPIPRNLPMTFSNSRVDPLTNGGPIPDVLNSSIPMPGLSLFSHSCQPSSSSSSSPPPLALPLPQPIGGAIGTSNNLRPGSPNTISFNLVNSQTRSINPTINPYLHHHPVPMATTNRASLST